MVRLRRGPPPASLLRYGATWTQRWLEIRGAVRSGDWATQNAKKILSEELRNLAHGKCAFCESVLEVTSYLEIEHYVAKTVSPDLAFDWDNLFPICRLCNNAKSDTDHAGVLLKPDVDNPESVLWLNPDSGELEPKAFIDAAVRLRIERTLELCGLQRGPLCTMRIQAMQHTIRWLERLAARGGKLDKSLREEWERMIEPTTAYKFVIRHVFESHGAPELAAWDRARFEAF
jgi:uncharacterized protein (TIGR02646 family)